MSEREQIPEAVAAVLEALNNTDSNGTEQALNATAKFVASPEGTALAYGSLVFMALLPIYFGALRSVTCSKSKVTSSGSSDGGSRCFNPVSLQSAVGPVGL
ncbi:Minor histocompatibility antigen H13 [Dissostichus eleginoides]|uniref:Minor histocompatibility antigen H13 n=1 Tax=Dissostichus eleginoides TaxID=100907 RepID=A0AAD9CDI6_DISEL|nr:Minor histocompatibility antigen H13 [Dissostichus eleginoides]